MLLLKLALPPPISGVKLLQLITLADELLSTKEYQFQRVQNYFETHIPPAKDLPKYIKAMIKVLQTRPLVSLSFTVLHMVLALAKTRAIVHVSHSQRRMLISWLLVQPVSMARTTGRALAMVWFKVPTDVEMVMLWVGRQATPTIVELCLDSVLVRPDYDLSSDFSQYHVAALLSSALFVMEIRPRDLSKKYLVILPLKKLEALFDRVVTVVAPVMLLPPHSPQPMSSISSADLSDKVQNGSSATTNGDLNPEMKGVSKEQRRKQKKFLRSLLGPEVVAAAAKRVGLDESDARQHLNRALKHAHLTANIKHMNPKSKTTPKMRLAKTRLPAGRPTGQLKDFRDL